MRLEGIELVAWITGFLYVIGALEYITIGGIIPSRAYRPLLYFVCAFDRAHLYAGY
jgi:hypothetical protein